MTSSSNAVKQEPIEIDDSFSIASFDSPPQSSSKYDFIGSKIQSRADRNDSDDDVILLENDNKKLDLDDSQMGLFEKIRKNIKIKKEKVDSQQEDTAYIDVIDLASPPKGLSPISILDEDTNLNLDPEKSPSFDQFDPFPEPYSPTDDLPDLVFVSNKKNDIVSKATEPTSNEAKKEDENKDVIHPGSSREIPPISPIKKRPIQLIEPLPHPPKKHARRTSSSSSTSERTWESKSEKFFDRDKWKSSHKSSLSGFSEIDKEKRADALKEIELRKKEQKLSSAPTEARENESSASSSKPALSKIKTSKPKLLKLVSSLEEDESAPRQPVRKAHKPKSLPPSFGSANRKTTSSNSTSSKHSTKAPAKAVNNIPSNIQTSHLRTTAETTVDQ